MRGYWTINARILIAVALLTAAHGSILRAANEGLWDVNQLETAPVSATVTGSRQPAAAPMECGEWLCGTGGQKGACADRWWFSSDYVLLWTNGNSVPPLVSSNATAPPRAEAGVMDVGNTEILVDGKLDEGGRSGVAFSAGYWLDDCHDWAVQAAWWYAGDPADELNDTWASNGEPVLARPFFNVGSGAEDAQLVAYPDLLAGAVQVVTSSDLRSAEALVNMNWWRGTCGRIDLLSGYRYFRFREGVLVREALVSTAEGGLIEQGTRIGVFDQFNTANSFHGGTLGVLSTLERGCFEFDVAAKLGIGNVRRRVRVNGATVVTNETQVVSDGGLLALSSNMGSHEDDTVGLLPELNLNTRVLLTDHLSVNVGYSLMFLTEVYRAGDQIDRSVDPGLLPPPPIPPINNDTANALRHPTVFQESSTLCVQGLNVGCTLTY